MFRVVARHRDGRPARDLPSVGTRMVGVYFPANGKFYAMGGRRCRHCCRTSSLTRLNMIQAPTVGLPSRLLTPTSHTNNMACGVLAERWNALHLLRGWFASYRHRHFRSRIPLQPCYRRDQPRLMLPGPVGLVMVLPGGFTVLNNFLYILGGFNTITNGGQGKPTADLAV